MPDTDVSARVWPEDTGTGAADGNEDWDSAGYIGGMHAQDNNSNYVEAGLGITPDYGTPAFDLAPGLAYIKHTGSVSVQLPTDDAATYSGSWNQGVTFAVDVDQQTGIALTDGAVNRVYLATDLTTNDGAYVRVDTEASPNVPSDPYIQIAEIDTSSDTVTEVNRRPDVAVGDLDVDQLASALDAAGYDITGAGAIEGQSASISGEVDAASASIDQATIAEQMSMGAENIDLYVTSTGDDSNSGRSSSEALATLDEAINRAPKVAHGVEPGSFYTVSINLEAGTTFSIGERVANLPGVGTLKIAGDGGVATIESSGSSYGLSFEKTRVRLQDVEVRPADTSNPYQRAVLLQYGSTLITSGSTVIADGSYGSLVVRRNSFAYTPDCTFEAGSGTDNGVVAIYNSHAIVTTGASVSGGYSNGVVIDDNSGGGVVDCTIDGPTAGITTQDNSHVKANGATIQNVTTAFEPNDGGSIKRTGTTSLSSIGSELPTTFEGTYIDLDNGRRIIDGLEEIDSGTVTVTAGGSIRVPSSARLPSGATMRGDWGVAASAGTAIVERDVYYDGGDDTQAYRFHETGGNNDVDVDYRVWEDHRP